MEFILNLDKVKREGVAILIAEDEEGHYEPVAMVSTMREALEIAEGDLGRRLRLLDRDEDPGLCPYRYVLFARTMTGLYESIGEAYVATPAAPETLGTAAKQDQPNKKEHI